MAEAENGTIRRALVAMLALYAFVVSGFVSGLRPVSAMPAELGAICAQDGRHEAPGPSDTDHALCCVLACAAVSQSAATLPPDVWTARSDRTLVSIRWGAVSQSSDTARFLLSLRDRGPPSI